MIITPAHSGRWDSSDFLTVQTKMGYNSSEHALSLAQRDGIEIPDTAREFMSRLDRGTYIRYSNGDGQVQFGRSLGYVILGDKGSQTIYFGISKHGSNSILREVPVTTTRKDLIINIKSSGDGWHIHDDIGNMHEHHVISQAA